MAMVDILPRAEQVRRVDSRELRVGGNAKPVEVDPQTGLPLSLQAFVVSHDPKMTVLPDFFSEAECDHLIKLVEGYWMPSLVKELKVEEQEKKDEVANNGGYASTDANTQSKGRTSWSCLLRYAQTSIVERLEHRIAAAAGLPGGVAQMERMNMVRYAPGEFFAEHHDGQHRPKTVFVYLNDLPDDDGDNDAEGDTFFPVLGLSFKPRRGTAIMWENTVADGSKADGRMMHAGRAPTKGVKYGVNCFTNIEYMRETVPVIPEEYPIEQASFTRISDIVKGVRPIGDNGQPILQLYVMITDPKIRAIPGFLTAQEAETIIEHVKEISFAPSGPFAAGTYVLHQFDFEQTPTIAAVEQRCSAVVGVSVDHLARLRVVRPGSVEGLCNRGCGQHSIYVCLSPAEVIYFTRLGVRLELGLGDALWIPNVNFETGLAREELRTLRYHMPADGAAPVIGIDGFFHDNPLRSQQKMRQFVSDSDVCGS